MHSKVNQPKSFLISGKVVLEEGEAKQRYLLISEGKIKRISRNRPSSAGLVEIETQPQDWIFPGLIDLHTHASYNILPLWSSPRAPFDNRHVWRGDPNYQTEVSDLNRKIGDWKVRKVFSELQAIAGGTTLLEEPRPLDAELSEGGTLLCRNTGDPASLGIEEGLGISSVVDFFRPSEDGKPSARGAINAYVQDRDQIHATLVHVAEGRSGFGSNRGVDSYSRDEFEALMAHPAMADVEAVKKSRLTLIHGCGIDVSDAKHIEFLRERSISVVWSPASNMLLYDDTLDVENLINHGVEIAIGSDWSPSGSKHVWDEAKFARFFLNAIGSTISDAEVFKMVSSNPARILGVPKIGRIKEGSCADFFILRSPIESDSALEVFFSTTDRDVLATVVDGVPIYGDREFISQFGLSVQKLPAREGSAVVNKSVHLPESIGLTDFASELDELEDRLKSFSPPVLRSNLLSDSDTPYRRRFHSLRARVERFGWNVKQWKKSVSKPSPGRLPLSPKLARASCGSRTNDTKAQFANLLGATYIPTAVRLGQPEGLTAFLCATSSDDAPGHCPDVAFLEFYSTQEEVKSSDHPTVGGRLVDLVKDQITDISAHEEQRCATKFEGVLNSGQTYYLLEQEIDWYRGDVRVSFLIGSEGVSKNQFKDSVVELLQDLATNPMERDGILATVESDHLVLWEHGDSKVFEEMPRVVSKGYLMLVDQSVARKTDVKAAMSRNWKGVSLGLGDCVNSQFERRDLMPW